MSTRSKSEAFSKVGIEMDSFMERNGLYRNIPTEHKWTWRDTIGGLSVIAFIVVVVLLGSYLIK